MGGRYSIRTRRGYVLDGVPTPWKIGFINLNIKVKKRNPEKKPSSVTPKANFPNKTSMNISVTIVRP